jgi:ribose-phosphate pyrophosphokinase
MAEDYRPFGLAVPNYSQLGIPGPYFGDSVWKHLQGIDAERGFEYIPITIVLFPDGSEKPVIEENCRNKEVYVIHSFHAEPARHVMIGGQICNNLVRSDAKSDGIYLVELFNPYFRQDARATREPITAKMVADIYQSQGMEGLLTADPHSKQLAGFFRKFEPLPMSRRLAEYVRDKFDLSNAVVVSPDQGGYDRAERFANLLNLPLAAIHKKRLNGHTVKIQDVLGDVDGKDVFIRDDIVATGGTNIEAAEELRKRGARKIHSIGTHLGLYGEARKNLRDAEIYVIGTNSLRQEPDDYVHIVDISDIIAKVIYTKSRSGSLRRFFGERMGARAATT